MRTQNECRMYDAGRTTLTEMIWLDILEERHKHHNRIQKKCAFDKLNIHQGKSHDICDSDSDSSFCRLCQACCATYTTSNFGREVRAVTTYLSDHHLLVSSNHGDRPMCLPQ